MTMREELDEARALEIEARDEVVSLREEYARVEQERDQLRESLRTHNHRGLCGCEESPGVLACGEGCLCACHTLRADLYHAREVAQAALVVEVESLHAALAEEREARAALEAILRASHLDDSGGVLHALGELPARIGTADDGVVTLTCRVCAVLAKEA